MRVFLSELLTGIDAIEAAEAEGSLVLSVLPDRTVESVSVDAAREALKKGARVYFLHRKVSQP